jgi:hypothetical protein
MIAHFGAGDFLAAPGANRAAAPLQMLQHSPRLQSQKIAVNIAAVTGVRTALLMVIAPNNARCSSIAIVIRCLTPLNKTQPNFWVYIAFSVMCHRRPPLGVCPSVNEYLNRHKAGEPHPDQAQPESTPL